MMLQKLMVARLIPPAMFLRPCRHFCWLTGVALQWSENWFFKAELETCLGLWCRVFLKALVELLSFPKQLFHKTGVLFFCMTFALV